MSSFFQVFLVRPPKLINAVDELSSVDRGHGQAF